MASVEEKVDMSLDDLIKKSKTTKFTPGKKGDGETEKKSRKGAKTKKAQATKGEVQQQGSKIKRQAAIAARRGIESGPKLSPAQVEKKAQKKAKDKKAKTTTVNLKGRKARGAATSPKKQTKKSPTLLSIPASGQERPITIKDFVLPKDTQLTISFEPKSKKPAPKAATPKKKNSKSIIVKAGVEARRTTAKNKAKSARQSKVNSKRDGMEIEKTSPKPKNTKRRGTAGRK